MKKDCDEPCKELNFLSDEIDKINLKLDKILDKIENTQNRTIVLETIQTQHALLVRELSKEISKIKIDAAKVSVVIGIIASGIGLAIKFM